MRTNVNHAPFTAWLCKMIGKKMLKIDVKQITLVHNDYKITTNPITLQFFSGVPYYCDLSD